MNLMLERGRSDLDLVINTQGQYDDSASTAFGPFVAKISMKGPETPEPEVFVVKQKITKKDQ